MSFTFIRNIVGARTDFGALHLTLPSTRRHYYFHFWLDFTLNLSCTPINFSIFIIIFWIAPYQKDFFHIQVNVLYSALPLSNNPPPWYKNTIGSQNVTSSLVSDKHWLHWYFPVIMDIVICKYSMLYIFFVLSLYLT